MIDMFIVIKYVNGRPIPDLISQDRYGGGYPRNARPRIFKSRSQARLYANKVEGRVINVCIPAANGEETLSALWDY